MTSLDERFKALGLSASASTSASSSSSSKKKELPTHDKRGRHINRVKRTLKRTETVPTTVNKTDQHPLISTSVTTTATAPATITKEQAAELERMNDMFNNLYTMASHFIIGPGSNSEYRASRLWNAHLPSQTDFLPAIALLQSLDCCVEKKGDNMVIPLATPFPKAHAKMKEFYSNQMEDVRKSPSGGMRYTSIGVGLTKDRSGIQFEFRTITSKRGPFRRGQYTEKEIEDLTPTTIPKLAADMIEHDFTYRLTDAQMKEQEISKESKQQMIIIYNYYRAIFQKAYEIFWLSKASVPVVSMFFPHLQDLSPAIAYHYEQMERHPQDDQPFTIPRTGKTFEGPETKEGALLMTTIEAFLKSKFDFIVAELDRPHNQYKHVVVNLATRLTSDFRRIFVVWRASFDT